MPWYVSARLTESAERVSANWFGLRGSSEAALRSGGSLTPTDAELLQQAAQGDPHVFRTCIDRFGPLVWTLARQILANKSDAEDAVQEVFAEVWRVAPRFDPAIASARAFVATIARRRLIDRGRVRQRIDRDASAELPESTTAASQNPLDRLAKDEQARSAMSEFGRLRIEQQKVIRLAVHEEWTHERIAEHLDMPVGTVKTHLRRGLLRLRESLSAAGDGNGTGREEGTS